MTRRRRPDLTQSIADVVATRTVATIPVLLTLRDISAIYRRSVSTIRRELQAGTFRPVPWDKYPYRWNPADVERDLETHRDLKMRNHGRFGAHRLRTVKVTAPHGRRPGKKAGGGSR
jgi:hypothetical protein